MTEIKHESFNSFFMRKIIRTFIAILGICVLITSYLYLSGVLYRIITGDPKFVINKGENIRCAPFGLAVFFSVCMQLFTAFILWLSYIIYTSFRDIAKIEYDAILKESQAKIELKRSEAKELKQSQAKIN